MNVLKNKNIWQVIAILAISIVSTILLFFPDVIENRYPYPYQRIETERQKIDSLSSTLRSNESVIQDSILRVEEKEEEERLASEREFVTRKGIIEEDFELHIPSILIDLEQNAIANNVDLSIDYNAMTTTASERQDNSSRPGQHRDDFDEFEDDYYYDEFDEDLEDDYYDEFDEDLDNRREDRNYDDLDGMGGEEFEDEQEQADISITENIDEDQEGQEDSDEFRVTVENPTIEGIDVNTIPLSISGTFFNVRSYIRYLDEIGMIEPSSVVIQSEGRNVQASIVINIFHGEVN